MDDKLKKMSIQVKELLDWKKADERQQIRIDNYGNKSVKTVQKDMLVYTGKQIDSGTITFENSLILDIDGRTFLIPVSRSN